MDIPQHIQTCLKQRRWHEEEVKKLKENFPTMGLKTTELFPYRTHRSVEVKALRLGLMNERNHALADLNPSDFELGYLAGLIDGEGCITLSRENHKKQGVKMYPNIVIVNTEKSIIDYASKILEGRIEVREMKYTKWKKQYNLRVDSIRRALPLLYLITPYLKSDKKRKVAKLLFEYCESRRKHLYSPYTERELKIFKEIRQINKRGGHY